MKKIIFIALFFLTVVYPFKSHKGNVKLGKEQEIERTQKLEAANRLTRKNVYDYLYYLTKDSAKSDLYFRIMLNESQLKSELALQHNNIAGMRDWEKNRNYFTGLTKNKYCIYPHWRYSVKDLVQYMEHYGNRAWYFRFKKQLRRIDADLSKDQYVFKM
jgi:hypothetical protein